MEEEATAEAEWAGEMKEVREGGAVELEEEKEVAMAAVSVVGSCKFRSSCTCHSEIRRGPQNCHKMRGNLSHLLSQSNHVLCN